MLKIVLSGGKNKHLCKKLKTTAYSVSADKYYRGTRRGLTEVPDDIPDDAKEVFLGSNDITEIKANAFSNLANCTHLYLARNKISTRKPVGFMQSCCFVFVGILSTYK